jgi:hypothetical protein
MTLSDEVSETFSATHHAVLFALISRQVTEHAGKDKGASIIRQGVRWYGEQRGKRMALRARANGHKLTMDNYLTYGEWRTSEREIESEIIETTPNLRNRVTICPWHNAWGDNNLMAHGALYCLEIDKALVRGFNPKLIVEVRDTLSGGGNFCEFVFHNTHDTKLGFWQEQLSKLRKKLKPGISPLMDWDYHLGHLYKTMREVVIRDLGDSGQTAMSTALSEFATRYGKEAAQTVKSYAATDFNVLP